MLGGSGECSTIPWWQLITLIQSVFVPSPPAEGQLWLICMYEVLYYVVCDCCTTSNEWYFIALLVCIYVCVHWPCVLQPFSFYGRRHNSAPRVRADSSYIDLYEERDACSAVTKYVRCRHNIYYLTSSYRSSSSSYIAFLVNIRSTSFAQVAYNSGYYVASYIVY